MIKLGDIVKDKLTGFTGKATIRAEYMYGCVRIGVASKKVGKDGTPVDTIMFDEPQLDIIKVSEKEEKPPMGGGPAREPSGFFRSKLK